MVSATGFPLCCTAVVLKDFGESVVSGGTHKKPNKVKLKSEIAAKMEMYSKYGTTACITAITNSEQTVANEVLKELGFRHSPWMSKKAHPETKIRLWWLAVGEKKP